MMVALDVEVNKRMEAGEEISDSEDSGSECPALEPVECVGCLKNCRCLGRQCGDNEFCVDCIHSKCRYCDGATDFGGPVSGKPYWGFCEECENSGHGGFSNGGAVHVHPRSTPCVPRLISALEAKI